MSTSAALSNREDLALLVALETLGAQGSNASLGMVVGEGRTAE